MDIPNNNWKIQRSYFFLQSICTVQYNIDSSKVDKKNVHKLKKINEMKNSSFDPFNVFRIRVVFAA